MNKTVLKRFFDVLYEPSIPLSYLFEKSTDLTADRLSLFKKLYIGVGNTSLCTRPLYGGNTLLIKKEIENALGNNHYSRYWLIYFFLMEEIGRINPTTTKIIEISSGSSAISLSIVCKHLGYNLTLVLPKMLPSNRVKPIISNNAETIFVGGYIKDCFSVLYGILRTGQYYYPNHSEEKNDILVNVFKRISYEICNQTELDYLISGIGNGTSTVALFDFDYKREVKKIGYYPFSNSNKIVFGLYGPVLPLRHVKKAMELCDEIIDVSSAEINEVRTLFKSDTEIISLGDSSLYGIYHALDISKNISNKKIVTIAYDSHLRY